MKDLATRDIYKLISKAVISAFYNETFNKVQIKDKEPAEKGLVVYLKNTSPRYIQKLIEKFSQRLDRLKEDGNISKEYPSLKNNDYMIFYNKLEDRALDNKLYIFCFGNLKEKEIALEFKLISKMTALIEVQKKVLEVKEGMVNIAKELAEVRKDLSLEKNNDKEQERNVELKNDFTL